MANLLYYWPLEPNRGYINDDGVRAASIELNLTANGVEYVFGMYCDDQGVPWFAKVSIPNVDKEAIPESALPIIAMLPAHLRSVLTLTWRPDVRFLPIEIAHLQKQQGEPGVKCKFQEALGVSFNATETQGLFALSLTFREKFELFSEGFNDQLPLKYRYLSLFKLFEGRFTKAADQESALEDFSTLKSALGLTKSLRRELKDVRDRCAHSALGRATKGITSLSRRDEKKVSALLPILLKVCSRVISELADDKVSINGELGWKRYATVIWLPKNKPVPSS